MRAFFLFVFSIMASTAKAATCTAGEAGKQRYNSSVMEFCDGSNWKSMKGTTGSACTAGQAGKVTYSSSQYQFCDGTNWYSMKQSSVTTCTAGEAGKQRYSSGAMQFCDGTNWYSMAAASGSTNGYFVLDSTTHRGNLGGLTGADSTCLSDLTTNTWLGKSSATVDAAHVHAFLCDESTCNNLKPSTTYAFAVSGSATAGGATFTTDSSGAGPNDSGDWNGATYFNAPASNAFATGRSVGTATKWGLTPSVGGTCTNWSISTASGTPVYGGTSAGTGSGRWYNTMAFIKCDTYFHLICVVDP